MSKIKILKTKISNTDENQQLGSKEFDTKDFVYIESYNDVKKLGRDGIVRSATDFAYANGCTNMSIYDKTPKGKHGTFTWLRTGDDHNKATVSTVVAMVYGIMGSAVPYEKNYGACPCLAVDVESLLASRNKSNYLRFSRVFSENKKQSYITVEIPEFRYPQSCAGIRENIELEELYKQGRLKKTGKTFTGSCIGGSKQIEEYEHNGNFYVRVKAINNPPIGYVDYIGNKFNKGDEIWFKVEPIKWIIRNYEDLPTSINPSGTGKAKAMHLRSEEAILSTMEFNEEQDYTFKQALWQNSKLRAFLNGYDIHEEINVNNNGNKNYICKKNYSYKGKGFVEEMDHSDLMELVEQNNQLDEQEM